MNIRWKRGQAIVAILVVMLLLVTAACGNSDDDDDAETPVATSTATTASADAAASPTEADDDEDATSSSDPATATESEDEDEPTATDAAQATATEADEPTATTASGESTATEASGEQTADTGNGTGDVDDIPEFETLDPELLPNFSMTMNFNATNFSGTPQTTLMMQMQQSAVGVYHFVMEADGQPLEFWTIGEQSWTSLDGEVIESPTGPLFDPADILTTGELIPEGLNAREDGTEEINGRQTTRWVVDGADYVAFMNEEAQADPTVTVEMSNGAGEVVVWIDNELNIMILAEGDVTWDNSDGTAGSLIYDYEIHDIGSTAEIVAPV